MRGTLSWPEWIAFRSLHVPPAAASQLSMGIVDGALSLSLSQDMKETYTGMSHSPVRRVRTHHSRRLHSHPVGLAISVSLPNSLSLSITTEPQLDPHLAILNIVTNVYCETFRYYKINVSLLVIPVCFLNNVLPTKEGQDRERDTFLCEQEEREEKIMYGLSTQF